MESMSKARNRKTKNSSGQKEENASKVLEPILAHEDEVGKDGKVPSEEKSVKNDLSNAKSIQNSINEMYEGYFPAKHYRSSSKRFLFNVELDAVAITLFVLAIVTRFYRLAEPKHIVFDELHFGKYVGMYMKNTFFFDLHPPLGKLLVSAVAWVSGFDGKFKFDRIGSEYDDTVPILALRFVPALCGSLVVPAAYFFMMELGCKQWTATLAGFLIIFDNALLTQSRFILMEPMLLLFTLIGLYLLLKFKKSSSTLSSAKEWLWLALSVGFLTLAMCVKYVGFFALALGVCHTWTHFWWMLPRKDLTDRVLLLHGIGRCLVMTLVPIVIYLSVFYVHLAILYKAGPHDSVMTSAFQASLEGGLASITKGQPLEVAHGSQITLRHTHGKACWLHSHVEVYPIRYPDKRGSSHQQQVTCYTFKDLNNWWIVRRPSKDNLVVSDPPDSIKHGDVVNLVHGITGRALNSHDVSGPMSPHNQEVSCYVDYNVSMSPQILWRVDIINKDQEGDVWHTIQSQVRLIHTNSGQALKYSGRQLPSWGFNQMEVVTDKVIQQDDTVWNVEEHRYTKTEDEKEREQDLINAEMIPLSGTRLSFWSKFFELQHKMLFPSQGNVQSHMYSSDPLEWPLMVRGIAYWVSPHHNGQIHLLGNVIIWNSGALALTLYLLLMVFYLLRRRRLCYDLKPEEWDQFLRVGGTLCLGYFFHYLPFFFVDRTLFLHHYLPAFLFKLLLTAAVAEHLHELARRHKLIQTAFSLFVLIWSVAIVVIFKKFSVLSYGTFRLSAADVLKLRWIESWDFIIHKD